MFGHYTHSQQFHKNRIININVNITAPLTQIRMQYTYPMLHGLLIATAYKMKCNFGLSHIAH